MEWQRAGNWWLAGPMWCSCLNQAFGVDVLRCLVEMGMVVVPFWQRALNSVICTRSVSRANYNVILMLYIRPRRSLPICWRSFACSIRKAGLVGHGWFQGPLKWRCCSQRSERRIASRTGIPVERWHWASSGNHGRHGAPSIASHPAMFESTRRRVLWQAPCWCGGPGVKEIGQETMVDYLRTAKRTTEGSAPDDKARAKFGRVENPGRPAKPSRGWREGGAKRMEQPNAASGG